MQPTAAAILSVHNFYRERGGEDQVFYTESDLLRSAGHRVEEYRETNERIRSGALTMIGSTWNQRSFKRLQTFAKETQPDIAHLHNTFPLISPSAYYALAGLGLPVVQKLSNFRLICPGALLLRDGSPCQECVDQHSLLPALKHRCYRNSLPGTSAVAGMLSVHRALGTWQNLVDVFIALSEFSRAKFVAGGLPPNKIVVKHNFISPDPGIGSGLGDYALFVGRLSHEKGIDDMREAWNELSQPLRIAGDGPLANVSWPNQVVSLGHLPREQIFSLMRSAKVLVFPSLCYENCPMTILEAFACGTPVIASNLGSMPEFVRHNHTGLLFNPGDPADLAEKVRYAFSHPEHLAQMRINARREYEEKYTPERNYKMLIAIYEQAIENAKRRKRVAS